MMLPEFTPHRFHSRAKKLRVTQVRIAAFLQISVSSLNNRLLGYKSFSRQQERKLSRLFEQLEGKVNKTGGNA